ncbi:hypothetical protein F4820DRAFT_420273 [Hypoxylon rubiginosum]|uniref:Uncharacterized protein n=1 Tax=Hypoxylon rubiginosum TaxID=110542 RepID=A0ACB9Z317_9PEZI|nr:hypothetical protein F4820DRAFT_420273 [Hypoxylon rubiginosum]
MSTVVLITGANRGIGKGLLERYLRLPNHTVIAANRNPDHPTSKALAKLPTAEGTKLIVVKVDATVWQDPFDAVKTLEDQGIDHIDIIVANAGVSYIWPTVAEVKPEDMEGHYRPNVYGYVSLYQATRGLLKKSKREPVLANMGSNAGSLSSPLPFPNAAYGPSKGAAGWYTLKIDMEEPWLNSTALAPGWVHTELGDAGAVSFGVDEATIARLMIGLDESCDGMMKVLAATSKERHGGKLIMWTGEVLPW